MLLHATSFLMLMPGEAVVFFALIRHIHSGYLAKKAFWIERRPNSRGGLQELTDRVRKLYQAANYERLSGLLPRVIRYSKENSLHELEQWAKLEFEGWVTESGPSIPSYRIVSGHWCDAFGRRVETPRPELQDVLTQYAIRSPIGVLEVLSRGEGPLALPDAERAEIINEALGVSANAFVLDRSALVGVLDRARIELRTRLQGVSDPKR